MVEAFKSSRRTVMYFLRANIEGEVWLIVLEWDFKEGIWLIVPDYFFKFEGGVWVCARLLF